MDEVEQKGEAETLSVVQDAVKKVEVSSGDTSQCDKKAGENQSAAEKYEGAAASSIATVKDSDVETTGTMAEKPEQAVGMSGNSDRISEQASDLSESADKNSDEALDMSTKTSDTAKETAPQEDHGQSQMSARPKQRSKGQDPSVGASDGPPKIPPQGGADGPGMTMMAKMMEMMMTGGKMPGMSDLSAMPGMPDMMTMMAKGMPNMAEMMAKGMPDMSAMMGKGMPDMSAMMARMPDMGTGKRKGAAKGDGDNLQMMDMMDCIIQCSLLRPDSDVSDDDDDSIIVELPCPHCSRFFASNVSLKTHILVTHDGEDKSLLNMRRLSIEKREKGKRISRDAAHKHSPDSEKAVAGAASTTHKPTEDSLSNSSAEESLVASEPATKGVKRAWEGRKGSKDSDTSGAAGEAESTREETRSRSRSGAATSGFVADGSPESRKRKNVLQMQQSPSTETPAKFSTRRSKDVGKQSSDSENASEHQDASSQDRNIGADDKAPSDDAKDDDSVTRHKKIRAARDNTPSAEWDSRLGPKEKEVSSNTDTDASVVQSGRRRSLRSGLTSSADTASAAAVSVSVDTDTLPSRRSLRSRKVTL